MNYVYDIIVNFNPYYLDFFEWNKNDKITHIKKLPIVRISNKKFIDIVNNEFKVSEEFINKLKQYSKIKLYCLIMTDNQVMACEFNFEGSCINRSSLLVDEELDIIENYFHLKNTNLDYNILSKKDIKFITRKNIQALTFLDKEIKSLKIPNDDTKIKYLYFECFGIVEEDINKALKEIRKSFEQNKNISNLYNFFKLIETNR